MMLFKCSSFCYMIILKYTFVLDLVSVTCWVIFGKMWLNVITEFLYTYFPLYFVSDFIVIFVYKNCDYVFIHIYGICYWLCSFYWSILVCMSWLGIHSKSFPIVGSVLVNSIQQNWVGNIHFCNIVCMIQNFISKLSMTWCLLHIPVFINIYIFLLSFVMYVFHDFSLFPEHISSFI